ncbi:MAG: DUF308 domain-containing protein [Niabella sp.]|nr:DUF308 domain-containing protein [Niabella sp.]
MQTILKSLTNAVKHWYIPLILGILFIGCGIYIFTVPLETYVTLSVLFSISFITSGIFDAVFSLRNSKALNGWGWYLVSGLLSFAAGVYLLIYPEVSMSILPFVAGFALLLRAAQLFGYSLDLKDAGILKWGNLAVLSVLGIILSYMLLVNPLFSGLSLVVLTGMAFLFVGVASSVLAFDLKKVKNFPRKLNSQLKKRIELLQQEISEEVKK